MLGSFMISGYKVFWTENALFELQDTLYFLETHWAEAEIRTFVRQLDHTVELISRNPLIFQVSEDKIGVRRAIVSVYNTLYFRINDDSVEVLSLFSNRQNPNKRKL